MSNGPLHSLRRPDAAAVAAFLAAQRELPLSYAPVGMTWGAATAPPKLTMDHRRTALGVGEDVFQRAVAALRCWTMFRQGWLSLEPAHEPPAVGKVVAVVARIGGLWWTNACRVLTLLDESDRVRRVGFSYGTLPGHAERGEERFCVELDLAGTVTYDLLAYSRPRHWAARLGYPLSRAAQRRFAIGSAAAMKRAAGS